MLKMKKACEKCDQPTKEQQIAFICSFECTFCQECTNKMHHTCPNCSGELLQRPIRVRKPIEVALSRLKNKLL